VWLNDDRLACQLGGATTDEAIIRNLPLHLAIDVQRAGPVRPWPARAGPGQPAAGRAGPDHTGLRAVTSAHGPVRGPF
jgi:hypothetical protein